MCGLINYCKLHRFKRKWKIEHHLDLISDSELQRSMKKRHLDVFSIHWKHLLEIKKWKWFLFPVFKAIKDWKFSWRGRGGGDKSFFRPIQHNWEANNTVHSHMQFTNNQSIHKCLTINALILRTNLRPNFECFNFISIHFLLNILNTMAHKCVC